MLNSSRLHPASRRGGMGVELLLVLILVLVALPLAWFWWRGSGEKSVEPATVEADVVASSEPDSGANDARPGFRIPELQPDKSAATEFGRRLAERLRAGETAFLNDRFDHEAVARRAFRSDQLIPEIHGPSLDKLEEHFSFSSGLLNQIEDLASIRFVRVIDRDGRRYLLFRHAGDDGLGDYIELEVIFDDRQRIRVADLTRYPHDMLSEEVRHISLANYEFANLMGLVADEDERGWVDDSNWFSRFSNCWVAFNAADVIQVYDHMPPGVRTHPFVLRGAFWAFHELEQTDRADDLIPIIESSPFDDPGLNLLVWDHYHSTGRHQEALDVVDRLEDHFGPDAGLDVRRATSYAEQKEWDAARDALQAAIQQEPNLRVAYEKLVDVALAQRDYDELVKVLQEMGVETGHWILHPHLDPRMDKFVGSPQHEQWIAHLRAEGVLPDDWVSDPWEALGKKIERAVNSSDFDVLIEIFEPQHCIDQIFAGTDDIDDQRIDQLRAMLNEPGFMDQFLADALIKAVGVRGTLRFLSVRGSGDDRELVFRLLPTDTTGAHLIMQTEVGTDGELYVIGLVNTIMLLSSSEVFRNDYLPQLAPFANHPSKPLTPLEIVRLQNTDHWMRINSAVQRGAWQECWDEMRKLPQVLQRQGDCLSLKGRAAHALGGDLLDHAIEQIQLYVSPGESREMWLQQLYMRKGEFAKARQAAQKLNELLGGDPFIVVLIGTTYGSEGDLNAATECYREAIAAEPNLALAYWQWIDLTLHIRDFAQTRRVLDMLVQQSDFELADLTQLPQYAEFVKSPEYKAWQAARAK